MIFLALVFILEEYECVKEGSGQTALHVAQIAGASTYRAMLQSQTAL